MLCQCPKCETIFRLNREQLDVADGQVSCSICQYAFDAYECLIPDPDRKNTAAPAAEPDHSPGSDLVPIIIVEENEEDDDGMSVMFSASLEDKDEMYGDIDLSRFEAATPVADSESGPDIDLDPEQNPEQEQEAGLDALQQPDSEPIPEYMESASQEPSPAAGRLTEQLESELMEAGLHNTTIATHRMRRLAWNSGAVLLILALGLQYIYVIRDELARSSNYRPWIESYCNVIGCHIPLRRELQSIELLQREIALDPEQDSVLRVRAMFVNQASFKQAYPIVQVTLSDTNNQVIAMRRLKPEEYLTDQSIQQGMLPGRQVTLDLRFFKPEQPVSTYEFDFL